LRTEDTTMSIERHRVAKQRLPHQPLSDQLAQRTRVMRISDAVDEPTARVVFGLVHLRVHCERRHSHQLRLAARAKRYAVELPKLARQLEMKHLAQRELGQKACSGQRQDDRCRDERRLPHRQGRRGDTRRSSRTAQRTPEREAIDHGFGHRFTPFRRRRTQVTTSGSMRVILDEYVEHLAVPNARAQVARMHLRPQVREEASKIVARRSTGLRTLRTLETYEGFHVSTLPGRSRAL
jgi:hypothetical protein